MLWPTNVDSATVYIDITMPRGNMRSLRQLLKYGLTISCVKDRRWEEAEVLFTRCAGCHQRPGVEVLPEPLPGEMELAPISQPVRPMLQRKTTFISVQLEKYSLARQETMAVWLRGTVIEDVFETKTKRAPARFSMSQSLQWGADCFDSFVKFPFLA